MERIVAQLPFAGLVAVDPHLRLTHDAVEKQLGVASGSHIEACAVPPRAHIGQSARTACFQRGLLLAVLGHGHFLKVVVAVERPVDGPVVRHTNIFPDHSTVASCELPLAKQRLSAAGRCGLKDNGRH